MSKLSRTLIRPALITVAAFLNFNLAAADPLRDLMESPEMRKFEQQREEDDLLGPRWLKPGSEFAALFTAQEGYLNLNTWIAPVSGTFVAREETGARYKEYVDTQRHFTSSETNDIRVRILVPHPKYINMIQYGLVQAFADLEPPRLQFENKENIEIRGQKSALYTHKDGGCSLILKSVRSSVIQVSQAECRSFQDLVKLAELLDLKRLERKLMS